MTVIYEGFILGISEAYIHESKDFIEKIFTIVVSDYGNAGDLKLCVRNIHPVFSAVKDILEGEIDFHQTKYRFLFVPRLCALPYSDVVTYTLDLCAIEKLEVDHA